MKIEIYWNKWYAIKDLFVEEKFYLFVKLLYAFYCVAQNTLLLYNDQYYWRIFFSNILLITSVVIITFNAPDRPRQNTSQCINHNHRAYFITMWKVQQIRKIKRLSACSYMHSDSKKSYHDINVARIVPLGFTHETIYVYAASKWFPFSLSQFSLRNFCRPIIRLCNFTIRVCGVWTRVWTHPVYIYSDRFLGLKDGQATVFPVNYASWYFFSMIVCYLYDAGASGKPHSFSVVKPDIRENLNQLRRPGSTGRRANLSP